MVVCAGKNKTPSQLMFILGKAHSETPDRIYAGVLESKAFTKFKK